MLAQGDVLGDGRYGDNIAIVVEQRNFYGTLQVAYSWSSGDDEITDEDKLRTSVCITVPEQIRWDGRSGRFDLVVDEENTIGEVLSREVMESIHIANRNALGCALAGESPESEQSAGH